jgi:hypothetical protein
LANQTVAIPMASAHHDIDQLVATWAGEVLTHAIGLTRSDRQFLSDLKRPDRLARGRSMFFALERLTECAQRAPQSTAVLGPELLRGRIIARLPAADVNLPAAIEHENIVNGTSNLNELRYLVERIRPRRDALIAGWLEQLEVTRIGLDAAHREAERERGTISVCGR